MKRMACVLALATGTGLTAAVSAGPALCDPAPATAASGLQITLSNPTTVSAAASVSLNVRFTGGHIRAVELYIDGLLVKKQAIYTPKGHGLIKFELDGSALQPGAHEILVRAYDSSGNYATATGTLAVAAADNEGATHFDALTNDQMVQGIVPVVVKLSGAIHNPYASFYVDDNFLGLTNYAPFSYAWDTTRVSNGLHRISVDILDGDTATKIQTLSIQVRVNNPGGYTRREAAVRDLGNHEPKAASSAKQHGQVAESGSPQRGVGVIAGEHGLARAAMEAMACAPRYATPNELMSRTPSYAVPSIWDISADTMLLDSVSARPAGGAVRRHPGADPVRSMSPSARPSAARTRAAAPGLAGLLAEPSRFVSAFGGGIAPDLVRTAARLHGMGNVAAQPESYFGRTPLARFAAKRQGGGAERAAQRPEAGAAFQVAFDGTQIAFDVPPRVEAGMPLAPFRQIFEHTGGVVQWYARSQTVRAINTTREIEFRVGNPTATVNNRRIRMDRTPYVDRGRTIVPLSFVRDAMNVDVHYDPATGHLRIESKR